MRISRLRLKDLQRHQDLDLELAPGLTIVRGPNEAGKTTIERAIEYGLFRKVTAAGPGCSVISNPCSRPANACRRS